MWRVFLCFIYKIFQTNKAASSLLPVCAKQSPRIPQPLLLPAPAPLVVHPTIVQPSSGWSTRKGRIKDDNSTPAPYPERPNATSLRWQWKVTSFLWFCLQFILVFSKFNHSLSVAVGRFALPFLSPWETLFNEDGSEAWTQQWPQFLYLQLSKG